MMKPGWYPERAIEGIVIPRWLGLADKAFNRREVLLLPIPVNIVYHWGIRLYIWARWFGSYRIKIEENAKSRGYSKGYKDGFLNGAEEGNKKGRLEIIEELKTSIQIHW